jgi:hypothetical protein
LDFKEEFMMSEFEKYLADMAFRQVCSEYYHNFDCGRCPFHNNNITEDGDCNSATFAQKYELLKQYYEANPYAVYRDYP